MVPVRAGEVRTESDPVSAEEATDEPVSVPCGWVDESAWRAFRWTVEAVTARASIGLLPQPGLFHPSQAPLQGEPGPRIALARLPASRAVPRPALSEKVGPELQPRVVLAALQARHWAQPEELLRFPTDAGAPDPQCRHQWSWSEFSSRLHQARAADQVFRARGPPTAAPAR